MSTTATIAEQRESLDMVIHSNFPQSKRKRVWYGLSPGNGTRFGWWLRGKEENIYLGHSYQDAMDFAKKLKVQSL